LAQDQVEVSLSDDALTMTVKTPDDVASLTFTKPVDAGSLTTAIVNGIMTANAVWKD
jgi:hypothetical protein